MERREQPAAPQGLLVRRLRVFLAMGWAVCLVAAGSATYAFQDNDDPSSVETFCLGDGTGAPCPCSNYGNPGEGCKSSTGAGALLSFDGSPDIQADDFRLIAVNCPANAPGVFFGGGAGTITLPFGNGLLCVSSDVVRVGTVICDRNGVAQSPTGFAALEHLTQGDVRYYQFWFRDVIGPCAAAYNTSNGLRVQW